MYELKKYQVKGLKYAFSEVSEGDMAFIYWYSQELEDNCKNFLQNLNISTERAVAMYVKHGEKIVRVSENNAGNFLNIGKAIPCDALVTDRKNVALFLLIADCVPLIIVDKKKTILSIVHVGIVNTKIEFPEKVIKFIENEYHVDPKNLEVIIGPSLRKEHFVYEYFDDKDSDLWKGFVEETGDGKYMIDNVGAVKKQLTDSGVKKENIYDCGIDTYTDERFFSHKRDYDLKQKDQGRFATLAMLE